MPTAPGTIHACRLASALCPPAPTTPPDAKHLPPPPHSSKLPSSRQITPSPTLQRKPRPPDSSSCICYQTHHPASFGCGFLLPPPPGRKGEPSCPRPASPLARALPSSPLPKVPTILFSTLSTPCGHTSNDAYVCSRLPHVSLPTSHPWPHSLPYCTSCGVPFLS